VTQKISADLVAQIRAQIQHPIIDSDAHYNEFLPIFREPFLDAVGRFGGADMRAAMASAHDPRQYLLQRTTPMGQAFGNSPWSTQSPEERRDTGTILPAWSPPHSNALDKATSYSPQLLNQRIDEIGIDYTVLYPTTGLVFPHIEPDELRQVACRAYNVVNAESYAAMSDRMTPAAVIPMNTPNEAVAELEYCVKELGYKVAMIGPVIRPIPSVHRERPDLFSVAFRLDTLGIDSDYDYDPFWAKCTELKIPLVAHSATYGVGFRRSPTNYIFNQTGTFAEAGDIFCRSLFLGGVTRRFPALKFQFLECGVGWACILYAELVHRWGKRNMAVVREHVERAAAAESEFARLMSEHASGTWALDPQPDIHATSRKVGNDFGLDDFAACEIETEQDLHDLFVPKFFFGCEADDPITPWAFNTRMNPLGARLRATLGSDLGHWDVPDMRGIVPEAFEMVEDGLLDADQFRAFTFGHPAEFFAGVNPDFFAGTRIESAVAAELSTDALSG
jgi:predicted TIM-barrel fold metal-dependent hydrolase